MKNKQLPKRNKRRNIHETFFALNLRAKLKKEPIELIKITKEECIKELERRSRTHD